MFDRSAIVVFLEDVTNYIFYYLFYIIVENDYNECSSIKYKKNGKPCFM